MSKFSLETLAEGIRSRHVGEESSRLVEKWSRTGLLRGMDGTKSSENNMFFSGPAIFHLRDITL